MKKKEIPKRRTENQTTLTKPASPSMAHILLRDNRGCGMFKENCIVIIVRVRVSK